MYKLRMKTRRRALTESQTRNSKIHRTVPIKKINLSGSADFILFSKARRRADQGVFRER